MDCGSSRTVDCDQFGGCTGDNEVCENNQCVVPGAPANDECGNAEVLNFVDGIATASGDTSLASDSYTPDCAGSAAVADVVYTFTLTEPKNVRATMTASWDEVIYITNACPVTGVTDEEACDDEPGEVVKHLGPGTYYIWADGYFSSSTGTFTLEVELTDPPQVPGNDVCADAVELQFGGTDSISEPGTTLGAFDDDEGTCSTVDDGDVYYWFEISGTDNRSLTATVTPTGSSYRPTVYIRAGDCATNTEVACARASSAGSNAVATALSLAPGIYYAVVDGVGSTGDFTLDLQLGEEVILPDNCTSPGTLAFSASGTSYVASVSGDTRVATADADGSCFSNYTDATGKDLVYTFDTTGMGPRDFSATVTFGGSMIYPHLYLRTVCDSTDEADEVACAARTTSGPMTLEKRRMPEGVYYLWVDTNYATDAATFDLEVTLAEPPEPPANDLCEDAIALTFIDDVAEMEGTTVAASDDSTGTCGTMSGGDVVYSFEIPAGDPRSVMATVTRDSGASTSFSPAVYIRSTCDSADPAEQLGCGTNSSGTATATVLSLEPGEYFVIVDSTSSTDGAFELSVSLGEAIDLPDNCNSVAALDLTSGADSVTADTTLASNDSSSCGGSGPDLVYSFELLVPSTVDIVLEGAGVDWVLSLRDVCADATGDHQLGCVDSAGSGGREALRFNNLAAGEYFIWVDGYSTSSKGPFTLSVTATALPPVPDNDTCAAPIELVLTDNMASVTGQTLSALDDYEGSCSGTGTSALTGGDVVYLLELESDSSVAVKVETSDGFKPGVYVRAADCAGGTEVACHRATSNNGTAMVIMPNLTAGPYYVFVDGADGQGGYFDLTVITGTVGALPDDCAQAQPLDVSSGSALVIGDTTNATQSGNSTCSTSTYQDVVYTFTTTELKNFEATVQFTSSSYGPNLYLRKSACDSTVADDEVACAKLTSGGKLTLTAPGLPADTYWLWVDHPYSSEKGPFVLEVKLTDPIANDTCDGAEAITLIQDATSGDMVGTASGTTTGAFDSGSGYCGGSGVADVMYSFEIAAEQTVEVVVTPTQGSTLKPLVHLRATDCDDAQAEVLASCSTSAAANAGAPASVLVPRLPQGPYYVWVDGQSSSAGAFDLTVSAKEEQAPQVPLPARRQGRTSAPSATAGEYGGGRGDRSRWRCGAVRPSQPSASRHPSPGSCDRTSTSWSCVASPSLGLRISGREFKRICIGALLVGLE